MNSDEDNGVDLMFWTFPCNMEPILVRVHVFGVIYAIYDIGVSRLLKF